MFVIKFRKIFYTISIVLIAVSLYGIFAYGLKFGIDFKGGSIVEAEYSVAPSVDAIKANLTNIDLGEYSVQPTGDKGLIFRTRSLSDVERTTLLSDITAGDTGASIKRFDSVGPVLGEELRAKSAQSIFFVLLAIVLFITFAFRGVSKPVSSWKYGLVAIVALLHDVVIPTGVFAFLGYYQGVEVDALFVTALLVVLGFSVHDTIVVFDRTRENLHKNNKEKSKKTFEEVVGMSVSQTFTRSINTSLTTMLSLVVLYIYGAEATQHFALALLIGIAVGTYSSIFIGSPLLVTLEKWQKDK
ncbi:MAG: Protein-export rane protein SecF [Candidatus Taylorbacteria bacterium]|nr:Protein-export rane protein SecF [Candidatus Taylorbacteria bacterium]